MEKKLTKHSLPFITGMGYRSMCDYIYDEFSKFNISEILQFHGMKIFIKTDFLYEFISNILIHINCDFIIYSHNSDLCIDNRYISILNNKHLIKWYAQNVNLVHEKLISIPIGIANSRWEHGNIETLSRVINLNNVKDNLLYCNINISTNINERTNCLNNILPYKNSDRVTHEEYLANISKSYFVISPNGNGVDCHKHWESIYLDAIPIVTNSINIQFYKDYPIIIIDSWSDFNKLKLSESLYRSIYNKSKYNKNNLFL